MWSPLHPFRCNFKYTPILFVLCGALAIRIISIAAALVVFRNHNNFAPCRRNFKSFFPFKEKPLHWKPGLLGLVFKRAAAERAYLVQVLGVDKDPSFAIVFFMKQVD